MSVRNNKPLIIAHRGESARAPENTNASVNLAWQSGDDAVEIDVRLTRDKKLVVIHDATTKRTGNLNKRISKTPLKLLRKIDVGIFKDARWKNEQIPTLEEILMGMPDSALLFIEIKSGMEIIEYITNIFKKIRPDNNSIKFISFNSSLLKNLKEKLPLYEYFLLYQKNFPLFPRTIKSLIKIVKKNDLDGLDLDYKLLRNPDDVLEIKKEGLKLYVWTVNDKEIAEKLVEWGVDGITTDKAQWLKANINQGE